MQKKSLLWLALTLLLSTSIVVFVAFRKSASNTSEEGVKEVPPNVEITKSGGEIESTFELPPDIGKSLDAITEEGNLTDQVIQGRIRERALEPLSNELLQKSLELLSEVDMYMWPGASSRSLATPLVFPMDASLQYLDLEFVSSSRRFLKVYQELLDLPKEVAERFVSDSLDTAFSNYRNLYEDYLGQCNEMGLFSIDPREGTVMIGPLERLNNTKDGSPTLRGTRYHLYSLMLIVGNLGLEKAKPKVAEIAEHARTQRDWLYNLTESHIAVRHTVLENASLYNPLMIATALRGVGPEAQEDYSDPLSDSPSEVETLKLTTFDAEWTTSDLPVRSGIYEPDYSKGSLTVKFFPLVDDYAIDALIDHYRAQ